MPVDKSIKNVYIWDSGATDVTGGRLTDALGTKHGNVKPLQKDVCMVIGWGAKTKEDVNLGKVPVLNHPNKIRLNRNKLMALEAMKNKKVAVAAFLTSDKLVDIGKKKSGVVLPVIGRTKYHQGGKGFWMCPTMSHVQAAVGEGAQYFQNLIEIKDEYRLHVFGDDVLYAAKKVQRSKEETAEAYIRQELEKAQRLAERAGRAFDEATARAMLESQSKQFAQNGANMLVRSNKLGWKFKRVTKYPAAMVKEAVKSLKAIGLDFGAVDCCVDAKDNPYIIEVNTGPGLEGTTLETWLAKFKDVIAEKLGTNKKQKKAPSSTASSKKKVSANTKAGKASKGDLQAKIALMQEMAAAADDEEASVLNNVFGKMFGG